MYRPPLRRTIPVAVIALVALGLSFFFFAGRPPATEATEAPAGVTAHDTTWDAADKTLLAAPPVSLDSAAVVAETIAPSDTPPPNTAAVPPKPRYRAGEDPDFATLMGWPVSMPEALPGALLPNRRIIAYYGNPLSKRMGVLGEYPKDVMLKKLDQEVARWKKADPSTPVVPALHLVAVVAQGDPGPTGKYRTRMRDSLVEQVSRWADSRKALVFLDVQVGTGSIQEELPRLLTFLERPNFHLGVDPEFMMKGGRKPGTKIGTMDASDINYVIRTVSDLVKRKKLAPKVLVIH